MQERINDYREFGVANIWVLDPATQRGYDCRLSGFLDATEFAIPDTPIRLVFSELFAKLDDNSSKLTPMRIAILADIHGNLTALEPCWPICGSRSRT